MHSGVIETDANVSYGQTSVKCKNDSPASVSGLASENSALEDYEEIPSVAPRPSIGVAAQTC